MAENFKGYIGLPLETLCNHYCKEHNIDMHIHADMIESGAFMSILAFLLFHKNGNDPIILDFLQKNAAYLGKTSNQIKYENAKSVYEQFLSIFDTNK